MIVADEAFHVVYVSLFLVIAVLIHIECGKCLRYNLDTEDSSKPQCESFRCDTSDLILEKINFCGAALII